MALNNVGLGIILKAKDNASGALKSAGVNFGQLETKVGKSKLNSQLAKIGAGLAGLGASAVLLGGALSLANAAGDFEQGLAGVGAVTKATTKQLRMLRDAAIEAGIKTQFSPTEAVEGLTSLATAGQSATEATKTLLPVLDLAAGSLGQLGVAGAAEAVVGTLNSYGLAASAATSVTDKLLRITQLTNFQTRDFGIGLSKAAAAGGIFNQSLDDTLIVMGQLRNLNIDASSSATAFRESVRRLGSDQNAQKAITEKGIKIFDELTGKMRALPDIIDDVEKATKNLTAKDKQALVARAFGARGMLAFAAVTKATAKVMKDGKEVTVRGAEAIRALRLEMKNATGTASGFKDALLDTFKGQKTLLTGTLQTLAVVAGEPFAKIFKPAVKALTDSLNLVIQIVNKIPTGMKKAIATMLTLGAVVGGLVSGVVVLKTIFAIAGGTIAKALGGVLLAAIPIVATIGAITIGIIAVRRAVEQNFGGIGDVMSNAFKSATLGFDVLFQQLTSGKVESGLIDQLDEAGNEGTKGFVLGFLNMVEVFKEVFGKIKVIFDQFVKDSIGPITSVVMAFKPLGVAVLDVFSALGLVNAEASDFNGMLSVMESMAKGVVKWIDFIASGVSSIVAGLKLLGAAGIFVKDVFSKGFTKAMEDFGKRGKSIRKDFLKDTFDSRKRLGKLTRDESRDPFRTDNLPPAVAKRINELRERFPNAKTPQQAMAFEDAQGKGPPDRARRQAQMSPSLVSNAPPASIAAPAPAAAGGVMQVEAPIMLTMDGEVVFEAFARFNARQGRRDNFNIAGEDG